MKKKKKIFYFLLLDKKVHLVERFSIILIFFRNFNSTRLRKLFLQKSGGNKFFALLICF